MKQLLKIFGTGFTMGTADLIPGVSGGTIAFISGIYERLVGSIAAFDLKSLRLFLRGKRGSLWKRIDGNFLALLFGGIISAILIMAQVMHYLLAQYPHLIKGFFLGIIISSLCIIALPYKKSFGRYWIQIAIGGILGVLLTSAEFSLGDGLFSLILAGLAASSAMILPGISGSYILLILDKYEFVLGIVVRVTDLLKAGAWAEIVAGGRQSPGALLTLFIIGVILGLVLFAKLLKYILKKRHTPTILLLLGLMIGALPSVRPWHEVTSSPLQTDLFIIASIAIGGVLVGMLHAFFSKQKKA